MIYSAVLGEVGWQDFLDRLATLADVDCATLFFHDARSGNGALTLATGIPLAAQRDYAAHFGRLNPWMWRVGRTPLGTAIEGDHLVPRDRFLRSEYYNDFLRSYGLESGAGVTIERSDGRFLLLSTLTGDMDEARNAGRTRLLTQIAPHIRRASQFYRRHRLDGLWADLAAYHSADLDVATIILDVFGAVIHTNGRAEAALETGDPAAVGPNGTLRFRNPDLQDALRQMLLPQADRRPIRFDEPDADVTILPLGGATADSAFLGGTIAVLICRRKGQAQLLATRHGLTAAETRVAAAVLDGQRPRAIAEAAGTSIETVRSQLKSVFAKTGAGSQADLVRLAAGVMANSGNRH